MLACCLESLPQLAPWLALLSHLSQTIRCNAPGVSTEPTPAMGCTLSTPALVITTATTTRMSSSITDLLRLLLAFLVWATAAIAMVVAAQALALRTHAQALAVTAALAAAVAALAPLMYEERRSLRPLLGL